MLIKQKNKSQIYLSGFTLIELLVVISIIGLLSSVVLVSLNSARMKARDANRVANLQQIAKALQLYYDKNGQYPDPTCPCGDGGWETSSADPDNFIESLKPYFGGRSPVDPVNRNITGTSMFGPRVGEYYFAYYRYAPSPAYCACGSTPSDNCRNIGKPVAILVARKLEDMVPPGLPDAGMPLPTSIKLPRAVCGDPGSDGVCTQADYYAGICRDWSQEFDESFIFIE